MTKMALDKWKEAKFFNGKLDTASGDAFRYYLSAFISAGRSVTFALQKEYRDDEAFEEWYRAKQEKMKTDPLMRVMSEMRNHAIKRKTIQPTSGTEFSAIELTSDASDEYEVEEVKQDVFSRHKLGELPDDVEQNVPDDIIESFYDEYGDMEIESLCLNFLVKTRNVISEWEQEQAK